MKKKLTILCLILILTLSLLTGCGGSSMTEGAVGGGDWKPAENGSYDMGFDAAEPEMEGSFGYKDDSLSSGSETSAARPYGDDVKLILRADLRLETTEFDETVKQLNQLVADCKGYFEQSNVDMGSYYSDGYRYGYYTVRVPKDNYDKFLNTVGEVCHVTSRNESAEDIGLQYYDVESQIRLLTIKQDRLMKLLEQATTMEDIITLENALSDIQYQLERFSSQKNRYDSLINYSTIEIRLEQVQRLSGEPMEQQNFGSQLGTALGDGLLNTLDSFSELILTVAYNFVPLTIFAVIVIFFLKFAGKRRNRGYNPNGPSGPGGSPKKEKKSWFRKKNKETVEFERVSESDSFIPKSSEDKE